MDKAEHPNPEDSTANDEAYRAAILLEEIAKKAEPWEKLKNIFTNQQAAESFGFGFQINLNEMTVVARYTYPMIPTFGSVKTPEEIVEWLQTGLPDDKYTVHITQLENGEQAIMIQQTHREQWIVDEMVRLFDTISATPVEEDNAAPDRRKSE